MASQNGATEKTRILQEKNNQVKKVTIILQQVLD